MNRIYAFLLIFAIWLSGVYCESNYPDDAAAGKTVNHPNALLSELSAETRSGESSDTNNYDKRVERYAFGLGRRAYTYPNTGVGVKRLPVYNFGLGKRARPYSFGLGKRSDYDDEPFDADYERNNFNPAYMDEKRNRVYSFGLGKRDSLEDVERRGYPNRYGFGLGRR